MWYEINVSKNGKHYFATHERSITSITEAIEIKERLKRALPEEEGFKFTITQCDTIMIQIDN